jgi:hypothetical protein
MSCNVPNKWPVKKQLANWVGVQRRNKEAIGEDKRSRLEALGFDWNPIATAWEYMFAELVHYKKEHGDCNVPQGWPENRKLATWVTTQRQRAKKGRMPDDQRQRLEEIGFGF